jgi:2-polyprenyl-3-methyl-5-hydroxy-6-metoxy-1,4-benzoquinol methylase
MVRDDEMLGDKAPAWRAAYGRAPKTALSSVAATNMRRLERMGASGVGSGWTWLDLGAGDGNLADPLRSVGALHVIAVDYQFDLIRRSPRSAVPVCASVERLPLASSSVDAVVVMDVIHHLPPGSAGPFLDEVERVLRPAGHLFVWEPALTITRRVLGRLLRSPLSELTQFSRDKRAMVEAEEATLEPWLRSERRFPEAVERRGFRVEESRRGVLSAWSRYRRTAESGPGIGRSGRSAR